MKFHVAMLRTKCPTLLFILHFLYFQCPLMVAKSGVTLSSSEQPALSDTAALIHCFSILDGNFAATLHKQCLP